ncbi:glucose repression mediator protein [Coemansia sp. RSA 2526]|nr:glucose repression mediator protein [Coemansia sp. RSA 1752]KAJ2410060.1 glucose repression mediator protein [Coemansia sp. RSA 2526]
MQAPNHLQQQHSPVPGHIRQQMSAGMAPPGMHASSAMGPVPPGSAAQPNGSMHPQQRPLGSSQGHAMRQSRQPMPVQAPPHSAPHPSGSQQLPQQQQPPQHMAPPGPQQQPVTHTQRLSAMTEEVWLQIGTLSEVMGEHDRALAAYDNALRHNPYSQPALTQIANIHRSREEFDKAVEYFQRIINIDGTNGEIWGAIGNCYLMLDDLPKAYQAYQHALNSLEEAKEPKLWYGIGIMYDRYCSYDHAEEAFVGVLNMDPNFDKANEIYFRLGIIHKCQGKYAQSLECFNRILNDPPKPLTEADIWFQIGNVHELNSEFGMAKDAYDRVLRENPQHSKVLQQLATLYFRPNTSLSNIDAAVQLLSNAIEVDKDKAEAQTWYLLGRCYMVQRQYNKAYEAYQQAVYRDGNNANYWCSIGVLYYQINQYRDALDAYSRAIRIDPYLGEVWFDLGALYEACNNQVNDAIDAYSRAAELDRSNPVIEQRLDLLRRIQSTGQPGLGSANPPPTPVDPATGAGPTGRLNARGGPAGEPPVPGGAPGNLGAPPISGPIAGAPHATENARHPSEATGPTQQQALVARSRAPGTPGMVRPSHGALPPQQQQQQQMQQQMQQYGQQLPKGPQHAQPGPASGPRAGYSEDMAYGHYEAASRAEGASADAPVPHYAGSGHPMTGTPFPQTSGAQHPPVSRPYSTTGHPHVSAPYTPQPQPQSAGPVPHRAESGSLGSRHQSPAVPQQPVMAAAYPQSTPVVEPHPVAGTFQQGPMNGYQQYARQRSRSPTMAAKSPGFRRTQFVQQPLQSNDRRMEQLSESSHTLPAYGRQDSTLSAGAVIPNASRSDRDGDVDMEDIQPVGRKAYSLREEPTVAPAGSMSAPASDISMSSSTPALSGQTAAPIRLPPVQHGGMGGLMSPSSRSSPLAAGAATTSQAVGDESRKGSINGTMAQPSETVMSLASVISAAEEDKEGSAINSLMSLSSVATTLTSRPQASTPSTSSPQPSLPAIKSSGGSAATTGREPSLDAPAGREVVTNGVREMDLSSARDSGGDSEAASKSPGTGRLISEPKSDEDLRSRASSPLADGASETGSTVAAVPIKRSLATATADESAESSVLDRAGSRSSSGSVLHAAVAGSDGSGADSSSNGIGPRKRGRQGSPSPVPGKRLQSDTQDEMEDGEEPEDGEVFEDDEEARNDGSKSHE